MKHDWVNDAFEDYDTEEEWIDAYPDYPCPACGRPGVIYPAICICGCPGEYKEEFR